MEYKKQIGLGQATTLAFQHLVTMVVGCISVPMMTAKVAGLAAADQVTMVSASLLASGIAIIIQSFCIKGFLGAGLPLVIGSGFAYLELAKSIAINHNMATVFGAQLIAALFGFVFSLLYRHIKVIFAPIVKGVVVMAIGISLYKTAMFYVAGGTDFRGTHVSWGLGIFTLAITIIYNFFGKGFVRQTATLLGLVTGFIVALIGGWVHPELVGPQPIFGTPRLLPFGLEFHFDAILPFVLVALISAVQDIGQIEATTFGLWGRPSEDKEVRGGIAANSFSTLIGALFGGSPNAIAGQNVGVVLTTGVIARPVFWIAGGLLILLSFFPVAVSAFLIIPASVLGGATIAVFGSISSTGIKMVVGAGMSRRNMYIVGTSLAVAIGISYDTGIFERFPLWVTQIFGNPVVMAALFSIILNLVLPHEEAEAAAAK